jgi:hypothetical protein
LLIDGAGVFRVAGVKVLHVGGVAAVEELGLEEGFVGVLAGHDRVPIYS